MVSNLSDPIDAMGFWIKTFTGVYNKHAPYKTKRVKRTAKPEWLSAELQKAIHLRDLLKKNNNNKQTKAPWGIKTVKEYNKLTETSRQKEIFSIFALL